MQKWKDEGADLLSSDWSWNWGLSLCVASWAQKASADKPLCPPLQWLVSPASSSRTIIGTCRAFSSSENQAGQHVFLGPLVPLGVFAASQTIEVNFLFVLLSPEAQD